MVRPARHHHEGALAEAPATPEATAGGGRPLRVLHVSQPVDGGVGRWVGLLTAYQRSQGVDALVACPPAGALVEESRAAGVPVHAWASVRSPVRGVLRESRRLAHIVATTQPDLVHLHSSKAGLVGRAVLKGRRPTVFQPHAWSFLSGSGPVGAAAAQWERWSARLADRVLCVSEREHADGARRGVDAAYSVVHNGVDLQAWPLVGAAERAAARAGLGLPADAPVVACLGRLSRQKGQDRLLRAWPAVARQVPGAILLLAGDGPDLPALRTQAGGRADVRLLGHQPDARRLLAAADVVAMPSRWEGFSLAALEAAACGRCLLTTDVAGMSELLGPARENGPVLPATTEPMTVRLLEQALVARLRQPNVAAAEGAAARGSAAAHFALPEALARTSELYEEILGVSVGLVTPP